MASSTDALRKKSDPSPDPRGGDTNSFFVYENYMLIVWDEPKRQRNLVKHGLDFADLTAEFFENAYVELAKQGPFLAIGELAGMRVVAVVFRPLGSEAVSIISMRPASRIERRPA